MEKIQGGVSEFEPFIRYHTFGDSSINFSVILRTREFVNQYIIKHEFIKNCINATKKRVSKFRFPSRPFICMMGIEGYCVFLRCRRLWKTLHKCLSDNIKQAAFMCRISSSC